MTKSVVEIKKYNFSKDLLSEINSDHYVKGLWPLVYILSDENVKEAYVGETTDALSRMASHLKNNEKSKLTAVRLVTSDKFNKSATLDIESNLIKYLAGDGKYKLLNGNAGLANHNYYQKNEIYWDIFKAVWNNLKLEGVVKNTIESVNNSDLFKYSPYKSLSSDQRDSLIEIIKSLLDKKTEAIIIEGGAGTGKTVLAIYLFKLLSSYIEDFDSKDFGEEEQEFLMLVKELRTKYPNPKMALVVPMSSFRNTLKKVFKNIKGLNAKMVIGPSEVVHEKFDILIVDESHRLRRRVNLGTYFGVFDKISKKLNLDSVRSSELDWVVKQANKKILFYDKNQSIKPSDVGGADFDLLKKKSGSIVKTLKSQFRSMGGDDYVAYVDKLLSCSFRKNEENFKSNDFEFVLFDSIKEMTKKVKARNQEFGLARLVAGYSWKWVSKNKDIHDMEIDGLKLKWNSVSDDFINSENAINEVGCIHTTQGYDLNYVGLIFGNEISYDKNENKIVINPDKYFDKNGKQSIKDPEELKAYIINIYKTILLRGIKGAYVYVCDDALREYFKDHIDLYKSTSKDEVYNIMEYPKAYEMVSLPVFESVGCGDPLYADTTAQDSVMVRKDSLVSGAKYFVLKVSGDSMNKAGINDGDLVLCKKNYHPQNGDNVVALIGDDATIKKYYQEKGFIILKPCSTNIKHREMKFVANGDEVKIQAVVVKILH